MHTISLDPAAARRQRPDPRAWPVRALDLLAAAAARHRDAVRLAALPEHLLADIGLTRDAVRVPRPRLDGGR